MPVTPLHFPLAHSISKLDRRLSLPGLIVGSVIPDIEVPLMHLLFGETVPDHLLLHSILGATTIGTILAVLVTTAIYPPLVGRVFNVNDETLKRRCAVGPWLIISCFCGVVSHLVLDYTMHWYNALLWPYVDPYSIVGPLVLLFTPLGEPNGVPYFLANLIVSVMMVGWMLLILRRYRGDGLWDRLLIETHPITSISET